MLKKLFLPLTTTIANMRASVVRTFLTILGIVIGIAAVTVVMSAGQSAQNLILDQIRGVGSNLVVVLPGASDENGPPAQAFGVINTEFTNDDLAAIQQPQAAPHVVAISGYVTGSAVVQYKERSGVVTYQGVSPEMIRVENMTIASGRFFTDAENARLSRVVVLGSKRAESLFPPGVDPVGEKISLAGKTFTVAGVLRPRGALGFTNPDDTIFVPLATAQKQLLGIDYLNFARMKVDSEENIAQTKEDIKALLRARHDIRAGEEDDFSVRDLASALAIVSGVTDVVRIFLVVVAAISLVVGGIGVMNVMFIVLTQRLKEIGLRKALGATRGDIALQFLVEAIAVALIGGVVGMCIGIALTWVISLVVIALGYSWTFMITWQAIGIAMGISLAIGIVFGMYPALKASRVSPIEALRYE